ncbi:hypothetical protein BC833DRAFT_450536 [Globomyces pollinis-pini]|nr:hypothetical protein BC833DRAFT_450536 [Globomyces pollinis-pini]
MKKTSFKPFEILPDDDKTESQPLSKKLNTRLNLYVSSRYEYIVRLLPIKDLSQVFASDTWPTDEELSKLKQFTNERIEKASELIQEKNQLFDKKLIDIENDVDVDMKEPPVVEPTVIVDSDMNVKLEDISHESSGHSPQTKDKNSTLQENGKFYIEQLNKTQLQFTLLQAMLP